MLNIVKMEEGAAADEHGVIRRARKPRKTIVDRELEAFRRGYAAAADATGGETTMTLLLGALGGAGLVGMVWTLVHFL